MDLGEFNVIFLSGKKCQVPGCLSKLVFRPLTAPIREPHSIYQGDLMSLNVWAAVASSLVAGETLGFLSRQMWPLKTDSYSILTESISSNKSVKIESIGILLLHKKWFKNLILFFLNLDKTCFWLDILDMKH